MNQKLIHAAVIGIALALAGCATSTRPPLPGWRPGKPVVPATLPGRGLAQHDFLYAGEAKTRDLYLVRGGRVAWSYHHQPDGRGEISDAVRLSNGNILFAHQFGVTLISPAKKVLWSYDTPPGTEIHTAGPIGLDRVWFIQNGNPAKLRVANLRTGVIEREFRLPVKHRDRVHGQFRHARLTDAGTLLVAHMDLKRVSEYAENGRRIWSVKMDQIPWSAVRLPNGNTLICGGNFTREVNHRGEIVWAVTPANVAAYKFNSRQIATRLPNGNTLVNNWVDQWRGAVDPDVAPVQALEFTPDGEIVWALRSWKTPNLGPATTIQLLDAPSKPESAHFGSIR